MFKLIPFTTLILCVLQGLAQSNYQPATYTLPNGETRQGFVNFQQWARNPKQVYIKEAGNDERTAYTPLQIDHFEITGGEKYHSAIIRKNIRPEFGQGDETIRTDTLVTDTVFLRVIYEGSKFTLYNLTDNRVRYYVRDTTGIFTELVYGNYTVMNSMGVEEVNTVKLYRNQLMQYATNFDQLPKLRAAAEKLRYEEVPLRKFAAMLHDDESGARGNKKQGEALFKRTVFFAEAGMAMNSFSMKDHSLLGGLDISGNLSPVAGIGVDFFGRRNRGAFFFRAELQYHTMKLDGKRTSTSLTNLVKEYTYRIDISSISPILSAFYSVYNNNKIRCYAGLGVANNFSSYSNQLFTEKTIIGSSETSRSDENYFQFEEWWLNLHARAGIILNNQWHLNLSYDIIGTFSRYQNFSLEPNILAAKIGFRF